MWVHLYAKQNMEFIFQLLDHVVQNNLNESSSAYNWTSINKLVYLGPVSSCQVHQVPILNQDLFSTLDVPPGPLSGRYVGDSDVISRQVCCGWNFADNWCLRVWWDVNSGIDHHYIKLNCVVGLMAIRFWKKWGHDGSFIKYEQLWVLCISTSFRVLRAPKSWSKPFFQPFFNI